MTVYDEHTDEVGVAVDVEPSPLISLNIDKHHTCSLIQSTLFSCCLQSNTEHWLSSHLSLPNTNWKSIHWTTTRNSLSSVCLSSLSFRQFQ